MADEKVAAAVAKEPEQVSDVVIPKRGEIPTPILLTNGPWGDVAIIGGEYLSPSFMNALMCIIQGWDEFNLTVGMEPVHHGVHSIVFRDDGNPRNDKGESIFGHALATTGSMAINLEHVFMKAVEDSIETPQVSIYCNIWHHLMLTVMHELHHLSALHFDPTVELEDEEEAASEFSMAFSYFLAQNYAIEPGAIAEEPFFGKKLMEFLQSFADEEGTSEEDTVFYKDQQMKALEGIMYWTKLKDESDRIIKSFREFMHWTSNDEGDDPKWAKVYAKEEPAPVAAPAPVAEPAPAVAQPAAVAPAVPGETVEINAYTGVETEVFDVDPYLDAQMDMDAPPWDVDTPAAAPVVAAAVAPAPAAPVAAAPAPAVPLMPNSSGMAHGLNVAEVGECCMAVYRRLFNHMFTQCEQVKIDNTTIRPDGQGGGCGGFNNIAAIQTPIPISDIPNADKIFIQQDSKVNGKWTKGVAIGGTVIGSDTGNKTMLPKYDLYIITHEGHMEKRTLLPQNPWKLKNGGLEFSKPAVEAQNGKQIMYIYSGNVMKIKLLAENGREWVEDANWNIIG